MTQTAGLREQLQYALGGTYSLDRELGGGGMSRVFVARDETLGRDVVVKVLPPDTASGLSAERFRREISVAARLQHPHIVPVLSAGLTADGLPYYTMPYVRGESLRERMAAGPVPTPESIAILRDVARALAYAHGEGVVHRDIKPDNILLSGGSAVVTDFGIAKALASASQVPAESPSGAGQPASNPGQPPRGAPPEIQDRTADSAAQHHSGADGIRAARQTTLTALGISLGTPAYMAPEQAAGEEIDHRADLYAWGVVAYELVAGAHPFAGKTSAHQLIAAHISEAPPPLAQRAPSVPAPIAALVMRCLEKERERRCASAGKLLAVLESAPSGALAAADAGGAMRRAMPLAAAAVLLVLAAAGGAMWWKQTSERTRARTEDIPRIRQLAAAEHFGEAAGLLARVSRILPSDSAVLSLSRKVTTTASVETTPARALVSIRDYSDTAAAWRSLGRSPIRDVRLPRGLARWRVEAPGYATLEQAAEPGALRFALAKNGSVPPEMIAIPGAPTRAWITGVDPIPLVAVDDYLIDRHEVTNREYKRFVDAGGYTRPELWKERFVRNGATVSWADAMREFRDPTGRPGPSTWRLGTYPRGEDDFPVTGVSWYEAAAYAAFVGKSLPTVYHWVRAATTPLAAQMVPLSNFSEKGLAPVGRSQGVSGYGAYDMAGNAREWLWNSAGELRHMLGGAWNEPAYMFTQAEALPPFDRSPTNGFRCARYRDGRVPAATGGDFPLARRDLARERPVSDDVFRVYLNRFAYDAAPLDRRVEARGDTTDWRHEKVSFAAAYGGERVIAHLFVPKTGHAPYQTVVLFPTSTAIFTKRSDDVLTDEPHIRFHVEFLTRSGRAVVLPVYKGTYERNDGLTSTWPTPTHRFAEYRVKQVQDFRRTVDYLATRPELDVGKLAFFGISWGGRMAGIIPAVEPRVKVVVATSGGIAPQRALPEVDDINYIGRVRVPVLMLNGRFDATQPVESAQLPMFRMLGSQARDKRHVLFDSGHYPLPADPYVREVLDWLDHYLGSP